MSGGGASEYDASVGPGSSGGQSGMNGLLGMPAGAGGGKSKQPSTNDILKIGLQMMQHPAQASAPPMMFGQGLMGGLPQVPGASLMGGGMPQGSPFQSQSGPPLTQFPRF